MEWKKRQFKKFISYKGTLLCPVCGKSLKELHLEHSIGIYGQRTRQLYTCSMCKMLLADYLNGFTDGFAYYVKFQNVNEYEAILAKYCVDMFETSGNQQNYKSVDCLEIVYNALTGDEGFFDSFFMLEKNHQKLLKPLTNKQKSMTIRGSEVFISQWAEGQYVSQLAICHKVDMKTGNLYSYLDTIPQADMYRVASNEFWMFWNVTLLQGDRRKMYLVEKALKESSEIKLHYDETRNSILKNDGTLASWVDIAVALSEPLEKYNKVFRMTMRRDYD